VGGDGRKRHPVTGTTDTTIATICERGHRVDSTITAAALATFITSGHLGPEDLNLEFTRYPGWCCGYAGSLAGIVIVDWLRENPLAEGGAYTVTFAPGQDRVQIESQVEWPWAGAP
jgi:hypothetical protein